MISAPCKECTERKLGCHGSCKRYKDWCEERKAIMKPYRDQKEVDAYTGAMSNEALRRWRRRHGWSRGGGEK